MSIAEVKTASRAGRARLVVGVALSISLLAWMLYMAGPRRLVTTIASVPPPAAILTLAVVYAAIPLRILQWRMLLRAPVPFQDALAATFLGHLGNFLLPLRGGEVVRAYALARRTGLAFTRVATSVFLVRLQDLPPVLLLVALTFCLIPEPGEAQSTSTWLSPSALAVAMRTLALMILAAAAGLFIAQKWFSSLLRRLTLWLAGLAPALAKRINTVTAAVQTGLDALRAGPRFLAAQAVAVVCWALYALSPVPLLVGFGLTPARACLTAVAATAVTTAAHMLPSAPSAAGTYHAFCYAAVLACNPDMDPGRLVAYAFLVHLLGSLGPALPGLVFLPGAWDWLWHTPAAPAAVRNTTGNTQ